MAQLREALGHGLRPPNHHAARDRTRGPIHHLNAGQMQREGAEQEGHTAERKSEGQVVLGPDGHALSTKHITFDVLRVRA